MITMIMMIILIIMTITEIRYSADIRMQVCKFTNDAEGLYWTDLKCDCWGNRTGIVMAGYHLLSSTVFKNLFSIVNQVAGLVTFIFLAEKLGVNWGALSKWSLKSVITFLLLILSCHFDICVLSSSLKLPIDWVILSSHCIG